MAWVWFVAQCKRLGIHQGFRLYPNHRHGQAIGLYLADMEMNLAPDADVYRDPDPLVEEAIAVIEAVARVPQQVLKWGHAGVQIAWPQLYAFYYHKVIQSVIKVVGQPTTSNLSLFQWFNIKIRRIVRAKPGYYP